MKIMKKMNMRMKRIMIVVFEDKLQCRYCGAIMDIDRHLAREHSNSVYELVKVDNVGAKHEKYND